MKFENFNITLFRAMFGSDVYALVKHLDFTFKVTNNPVKNFKTLSPAHTTWYVNEDGKNCIIVEYNMHQVMVAAQLEGRSKGDYLRAYRCGVFAHELKHVIQMLDSRLSGNKKHIIWEGKKYPMKPRNHWKYLQQPWETEAFVAGYVITYGISEQAAIKLYHAAVHRARPAYIVVWDCLKALFGKEQKNG